MDEEILDELFGEESLWNLEQQLFAPKIVIPHPQKVKKVRKLQKKLAEVLNDEPGKANVAAGFSERNPHCVELSFRIDDIENDRIRNFVSVLQECAFFGIRKDDEGVYMNLLISDVCKVTFLKNQDNEE